MAVDTVCWDWYHVVWYVCTSVPELPAVALSTKLTCNFELIVLSVYLVVIIQIIYAYFIILHIFI
jgi:hypothetical protein